MVLLLFLLFLVNPKHVGTGGGDSADWWQLACVQRTGFMPPPGDDAFYFRQMSESDVHPRAVRTEAVPPPPPSPPPPRCGWEHKSGAVATTSAHRSAPGPF